MPSRWQIRLPGVDAARVTPEQVHAVVSGWFDATAEAHQQRRKAYSVSMPQVADGSTVIEVGLVDDGLVDRLFAGAARGTRLRFGSQWTVLGRDPYQTGGIPWGELNRPSAATAWGLRFVTLTTFRRGNAFTPNPGLKPILGGLRQVWKTCAPPDMSPLVLNLATEPVWLTAIEVSSRIVRVDGRIVSGFTGRLRLACDAPAEVAGAVDRLLRLAPYCGVGAYTTRGFGTVRLETPSTARQAVPAVPVQSATPVAR
ncbi:MAG: CRISPR system precrRNA processing endoribonuclease RAMP protein Cas6 [Micromonosporaceae bacterium]|nr:CRISPR system precrRNA processing endoribonuclease RAMP protein Cas6 [Micromonosporaceae bacterium]